MDIESYKLAVLALQQNIAKLHLDRQKSLLKSAEAEQEYAQVLRVAARSPDGGLKASERIEELSDVITKIQYKVVQLDKKIHEETGRLHEAQHELNLSLKQERLQELEQERNALAVQDRVARLEQAKLNKLEQARLDFKLEELEDKKRIYNQLPNKGKFHIITGINGLGKSRYLRFLADNSFVQDYCQRIICLSGTMYDRFPKKSETSEYSCEYLYFGNRVNNNFLSEKAPFRILSSFILGEGCNGLAGDMAGKILEELGFSRQVRLVFSPGQSISQSDSIYKNKKTIGITLEFDNTLQQTFKAEELLAALDGREIQLIDMQFEKENRRLGLSDLSSGERLYLLSTMALCFCVVERTLVLFDEPENSLHPQWQAKIIKDMVSIIRNKADECTVVIATHSPLIVSSAPNDISYIRDLPSTEPWLRSELYGRNADTILSEQFGLTSPRSLTVASLIQDCLTALTDVHSEPRKFLAAADNLLSHNIQLDENDPLHDTIKRINSLREKYA
ncbi:AAA family ATPase [Pseudomonas sp. CGJS7]|uniref:AAA family ATPase n=1 Tax=Pseudomonas sp. CGJS7 TaxID=3109348 RepID=UPI00300915B1